EHRHRLQQVDLPANTHMPPPRCQRRPPPNDKAQPPGPLAELEALETDDAAPVGCSAVVRRVAHSTPSPGLLTRSVFRGTAHQSLHALQTLVEASQNLVEASQDSVPALKP